MPLLLVMLVCGPWLIGRRRSFWRHEAWSLRVRQTRMFAIYRWWVVLAVFGLLGHVLWLLLLLLPSTKNSANGSAVPRIAS